MKKDKNTGSSSERILQASIELFARKGFANTGMRELADHAGVNLAMINYCYGSKKKLLETILDDFFDGYIRILRTEFNRDAELDEKIRCFFKEAVKYITTNRSSMIITLTELPHDDPDITEHKATWARQAMEIIENGICAPIKEKNGLEISPTTIGPLLIGMMSSRFLFSPIIEQLQPPGYNEHYFEQYPEILSTIFLNGLNGLSDTSNQQGAQ